MSAPSPELSLWWSSLDELPPQRAALSGDTDVDVAIIGGGFTGLWCAYYLLEAQPDLRVLVLEAEHCGFGASGRNGGWASALFAASDAKLAREFGLEQAKATRRAMNASIDEIARVAAVDGIDCRFAKGGTVIAARSQAQLHRAQSDFAEARALGVDQDLRWLDAVETRELIGASNVLGATYTPHCAALDPARLAVGLAAAVERHGGRIVEGTRALRVEERTGLMPPRVITSNGTVRADIIVRATEGWSSQLPGSTRSVIPVYSLMVATAPLSQDIWQHIGLANRATFADWRNMVIYGQRTFDDRLAFGGRGAPYHFGSSIRPNYDRDPKVFATLTATLGELFEPLRDVEITHRWGGPLGIPRDWFSAVTYDPATGMAAAGGYVGDGVTTTNLAGRTLRDLILGAETELITLPWVNHVSPNWEPEPLRWLGVNTGLVVGKWADASEHRRGKPSKLALKMAGFLGA